jgi:TRAP-type C4-dicarboxylate transport system substrate-binding protein
MRCWRSSAVIIAVGLLGAALLSPPDLGAQDVVQGPKVSWNVSVWGGKRAYTAAPEALAAIASQRTGGNFTITIHYAEALSPARENLDGLKLGAFEAAAFCSSYHPGKNPALTALDLPFLPLPNLDAVRAVQEAYFTQPVVIKELEQWGSRLLMAVPLPQYEFMGVGSPPQTLDAWRGKRVRALGGIGEAMRTLGAVPTTVPAPEVYTSLERGVVDAASFPFTYAHGAYKLHEVSRWYTINMNPGSVLCPLAVNTAAWAKLPDQYKRLLEEARDPAYQAVKEAYAKADERNFAEWKKRGLVEVRYTDADLDQLRRQGGQPVWEAWVKEMEGKRIPGRQLLDFILTEAKKVAR